MEGWVQRRSGAALLPLKPAPNPPHPGSADHPSPSTFQHCQGSRWVLLKLRWASSKLGRMKLFALLLCAKDCLKTPKTPLQQAAAGRGDRMGATGWAGCTHGCPGTVGTWECDRMEQIRALHLQLSKYRDAFPWTGMSPAAPPRQLLQSSKSPGPAQ